MGWEIWREIQVAVAQEFSDLPNVGEAVRVALRLSIAALLGAALGFERESKGKAAGVRTHMLVAMGAALFVLIPKQAGVSDGDLTRVLQGLVAGIGFLGAGAILKRENGSQESVSGLTTAAGIWLTAAIGVAAGLGREATAVLSTLMALAILAIVPRMMPDARKEAKN